MDSESIWRMSAEQLRRDSARCARKAIECDLVADLLALEGLDLSDLFTPTPGDALALRGDL